ncbi:aspartyl protease family protein [Aquimarina sp. U1-2]|uniref:aspartyl protease family protein n=1 Tax=Aquimarina sp. U1-2 TaxID=2823141 RepID=UPI001AEC898A|nr:aspartyl protease family protein [Aquimarina sp. U1-2]MBP2830813.1 aspartyl protease family protein [Aquimarina sp. U1-2]
MKVILPDNQDVNSTRLDVRLKSSDNYHYLGFIRDIFVMINRFCKGVLFVIFWIVGLSTFSQSRFTLPLNKKNDKIKFELANNLIIIPVELNGVELSFILDTGVGSTIIFSIDNKESLELKNATKIYLRGLGDEAPVEAIKSLDNTLKIGDAVSARHSVFLVFDESINFSPRMGFPIHGIIGYDFFKDFIFDINYTKKVIKINTPDQYTYKKCDKCYRTNINFSQQNKRPILTAQYKAGDTLRDLRLLLDSGSGSSLWLFEDQKKGITIPKSSFPDFLGKGFNGDIYGSRSKISELHIGNFVLNNVTTAFPDSKYIQGIALDKREGSLGGNVLRRFNLTIDYPNQQITFKKNSFFNKPFYYNMSGLTIQHVGYNAIEPDPNIKNDNENVVYKATERNRVYLGINRVVNEKTLELSNYILRPKYEISDVRPNSPADLVGLQRGDLILEVNGKKAYQYKLSQLNDLFYFEEGKKIRMTIKRLGIELKYTFFLKKVI